MTSLVVLLAALPLALTAWALLDAAHRPEWAWALAGRRRVVWIAAILFGAMALVVGLAVSAFYLVRVRPEVAAAEEGRVPGSPKRRRRRAVAPAQVVGDGEDPGTGAQYGPAAETSPASRSYTAMRGGCGVVPARVLAHHEQRVPQLQVVDDVAGEPRRRCAPGAA